MGAVAGLSEDDGREVVGADVFELSAVAPHRRPRRGDDDRLRHYFLLRDSRNFCTPSANSLLPACASWR